MFELFRFGIEHDIEDIKLIELDTAAITVPYIESFLRAIVSEPELMELPVLWKESHIPLGVKKAHALSLRTTNGKELKVSSYRLTCSHEHKQLDNETIKCCEMSKYGSLTINTTGEIIPCTGDPNKKISLREEVKTKNIRGVIAKISAAILEIQEQKCPIFS